MAGAALRQGRPKSVSCPLTRVLRAPRASAGFPHHTLRLCPPAGSAWKLRDQARASKARTTASPVSGRSEEHTSELQSLMRISYAVFCLKKKNHNTQKS